MNMQLEQLQRQLGYQFANSHYLVQALTHRSAAPQNNERLEFLGDSILNFAIARALYDKFPKANEGELSRMRAALVKEQTLALLARQFELGDYMRLGAGELKSGGFRRESILADCVEAIIAAIYFDSGMDKAIERVSVWFVDLLHEMKPGEAQKDAKTRLQEHLQGRRLSLPTYEVIDIKGEAHNQTFTVRCQIVSLNETFTGIASSRRKAEQHAAEQVLAALGIK